MKIQVLYFAVFRERLGQEHEIIDLPDGADVAVALAHLASRHSAIAQLSGKFRVAVNQTMVGRDAALRDGDELALIPPVAGGNERYAVILDQPLSLDRCVSRVSSEEMGGLVTFTGVVRRQNRGRVVTRLHYEAYKDMAENVMRGLCDEIEAEFAEVRLAVEHRVGILQVGDVAVVIAAAAPHRAEAFHACRAMIDRLKERVPIWKKEITSDGAEWIGLGP
ncbi:MAG: molybdopterin converting factor subunit 1 [Proteobacteria bacterium]|nr:molybdopterin converting factor subunit 1 [Pseudomonadota bacterium]